MVNTNLLNSTVFAAGLSLSAIIFAIFSIVVTGLALWNAARSNEKEWFWGIIIASIVIPIIPAIIYLIIRRKYIF